MTPNNQGDPIAIFLIFLVLGFGVMYVSIKIGVDAAIVAGAIWVLCIAYLEKAKVRLLCSPPCEPKRGCEGE